MRSGVLSGPITKNFAQGCRSWLECRDASDGAADRKGKKEKTRVRPSRRNYCERPCSSRSLSRRVSVDVAGTDARGKARQPVPWRSDHRRRLYWQGTEGGRRRGGFVVRKSKIFGAVDPQPGRPVAVGRAASRCHADLSRLTA